MKTRGLAIAVMAASILSAADTRQEAGTERIRRLHRERIAAVQDVAGLAALAHERGSLLLVDAYQATGVAN